MVRHHLRLREPRWQLSLVINAVGAVTTGIVALVVVVSKFTEGAWIPAAIIPLLVVLFRGINRHYSRLATQLRADTSDPGAPVNHTMVVLVSSLHRGALAALAYASSLHPAHLTAIHVCSTPEEQERIEQHWEEFGIDVPLEIIFSPYRDLQGSVLGYLDEIDERWGNQIITVIIPEFLVRRWWEHLLHNQSALFLKGKLLFRRNVAVLSLPYHTD